jgi:hypothetical protein
MDRARRKSLGRPEGIPGMTDMPGFYATACISQDLDGFLKSVLIKSRVGGAGWVGWPWWPPVLRMSGAHRRRRLCVSK